MADQAVSQQPVVLLIDGYLDELEWILNNGFTKHLFPEVKPTVIELEAPAWLFSAADIDELEDGKPDLGEEELQEWRKGREFAGLVTDYLLDKSQEAAEGILDLDAVQIIILDMQSELTAELEAAIKDVFPHAFICESEGNRLTYLDSLPIEELNLKKNVLRALKSYRSRSRVIYASWLVGRTEDALLDIPGIGKSAIQNIKDALAGHGAELRKE